MKENIPKAVFASFNEEEHPPYPTWIMSEAGYDLGLADLIERREMLVEDVAARGGFGNLELEERGPIDDKRRYLHTEIVARKIDLGLVPPPEPRQR